MGSYTMRFRCFVASILAVGFLFAGTAAASAEELADVSATAAAGRLCVRSVPLNIDFCLLP